MDAYKRLTIEYQGIRNPIDSYTHNGVIINLLDQLEIAISQRDLDTIRYTLDGIDSWYRDNLSRILQNEFVGSSEQDDHRRNAMLVYELVENFKDYVFPQETLETNERHTSVSQDKLIFLSHRSSDKKYADALRNFIVGLGVKNNQLIYSSHPLHKIPLDQNIYDYLRDNLNANVFVIILWSDQYLESPACLNEMGAAWLAQSDYTNIYVPSFSFGNPKYHQCAVDTRKMGAVLNGDQHCKASMLEFKDKVEALFELENDDKQVTYLLDQFLEEIGE